jgi:Spy/CpxP family protein refolding chaperone
MSCHSHAARHAFVHAGPYQGEPRGRCGCGPRGHDVTDRTEHHHWSGDDFAGGFGVRRPLRFLAWKLGLGESQVEQFAAIINELKTERAQSAVDDRRALALYADAAQGEVFDAGKAAEAASLRSESEARLQKRVSESLASMHALLDGEQRGKLAYLLRTGTLVM